MEANQEIIDLCLNYLNRILNSHQEDAIHDPKVAISCISLLWECVKCNEENFNFFIAKKGVYLLLDVIEVPMNILICSFEMQEGFRNICLPSK